MNPERVIWLNLDFLSRSFIVDYTTKTDILQPINHKFGILKSLFLFA